MIFSVYDYDRRTYDYYEGPGPRGTHAGAPPLRAHNNQLGATPEQASWIVPVGAKKIGSGELAKGRIAVLSGIGDLASGDGPFKLGVIGLIAYLAWKAYG